MMDFSKFSIPAALAATALLAACTEQESPGDVETFSGISEDAVITLTGTEPFWNMEIKQGLLLYTTPDNPDGDVASVTRFAGNNGLGISGELAGQELQIAITPGECSDGMSDRTYPFTATVTLSDKQLNGCGFTDSDPFTGDASP